MPERDPVERLNDALERFETQDHPAPERDIRGLLSIARRLRGMPREAFRIRLRTQLEERAMTASTATSNVSLREGVHSLTLSIFLKDSARFIEFVKKAFGA